MTIIAQISDLHVQVSGKLVYGVVDTTPLVAEAIAHLSRLKQQPDIVIASGDLVQDGTIAEYELLKTMLAPLQCPVYLMPGNHDHRNHLKQVFASHTYLAKEKSHLSYTVEGYPIQMLMLDSIIPGKGSGCVDPERLTWLEQQLLAAPATPTLIFMHHPPFATGIPWMDRKRCQGHGALANLISQHPQVKRISCGHLHRTIYCPWAGTIASSQPSLVHQSGLDFTPDAPSQFVMEPPAYQLHVWTHENLVSHTLYVGQFDGPYRFSDGKKMMTAAL
ncbi:phosphodiesterase [Leptothoe spongobia]|uniref:Phosphodiesterase n=1 Tax=Leptothoe spongobia TAU-MAC 1115 TaxID=1967444 RepID=A0A947GIB9_9CYAN|nr:phosphodiesterase [Leptothoe spongobia]MBT9314682.1 phosphodiesterase [Leptothoe spongobia TAU-MAC 1115]